MSQIAPYDGDAALVYSGATQAQGHSTDAHDLERLVLALRKRWRLFLAIAGGFVLLVMIATILMPKSYTSTVRLLVGRPGSDIVPAGNGPDTALPVLNALVLQSGTQSAETLAELAQQHDLAAAVVNKLDLRTTPQELLDRISVKPVVNTGLLNLSVRWKTPEGSAQIANAFANAYTEQERNFVRSQAEAAIGYLSQELPDAQAQMRQTASRLAEFQSTHGYLDATAHAQTVVNRLETVDTKLDALSIDESEAKALLKSVDAQLAAASATIDSSKDVAQNPVSNDLRTKLADVETQLAEAEQKYTSAHPTVVSLRQQRAALLAQLAAQPSAIVSQTTVAPNPVYQSLEEEAATYRARIDGDDGQLRALKAERKAVQPAISALPDQAVQFSAVQEDAKRAANIYNALEQKYSDALIAKTTAISDVIVVQPANADDALKSPDWRINLAISLAVGLLLGLTVVYVLDFLDRRTTERDFAALLGLPVMARIPAFDSTNPRMLPWLQTMTVEAFLHLCVTLKLGNKKPVRTLALLSARRGDGKTTVAYNLAKSLATLQPGVLLIDADLRQPTLHEKAGCANGVGLSDVLERSVPLEKAVQRVSEGLDILTSRGSVANPVVLLQTTFEDLLAEARLKYSMVIVDAPALVAVSDAFLVAARVDASLFVVSADRTQEKDMKKVAAELALVGIDNVLGIVVNRDAPTVNDYSDYFAQMKSALPAGSA
jgi:capsular exopolysaccharide synthesis family protein